MPCVQMDMVIGKISNRGKSYTEEKFVVCVLCCVCCVWDIVNKECFFKRVYEEGSSYAYHISL